ncbi:MAG: suppressor of fused domain protein [Hyphomonas sp.]
MSWAQEITDHYRKVWGAEPETCQFSAGPVDELPEGFTVVRFPPHGDREMWTYATVGMSVISDECPMELHLFSPHASPGLVEILYAVAHYNRNAHKLGLAHTVNFGQPWIDESSCQYGLVSLPYLDGPGLETAQIFGREVNFYWLIPIAKSEVDFKKACGIQALEDAFERAQFNYLDPHRQSVA